MALYIEGKIVMKYTTFIASLFVHCNQCNFLENYYERDHMEKLMMLLIKTYQIFLSRHSCVKMLKMNVRFALNSNMILLTFKSSLWVLFHQHKDKWISNTFVQGI